MRVDERDPAATTDRGLEARRSRARRRRKAGLSRSARSVGYVGNALDDPPRVRGPDRSDPSSRRVAQHAMRSIVPSSSRYGIGCAPSSTRASPAQVVSETTTRSRATTRETQQVKVITSGGFTAAFNILGPAFAQATGRRSTWAGDRESSGDRARARRFMTGMAVRAGAHRKSRSGTEARRALQSDAAKATTVSFESGFRVWTGCPSLSTNLPVQSTGLSGPGIR